MATIMDLDELIRLEDALESIMQSFSRQTFVDCHSADYKQQAGETFDIAREWLWSHKTPRKALNEVRRQIETYR